MHDRVCPPRRMRFSFESRCRIVALIADGESPQAAAAACGASRATGYRLWRRFREGGYAALADRASTPKHQPRRLAAAAEAQQPSKVPRVGVLRSVDFGQREAFEGGLRDLGWTPGTSILIEYRYADGKPERLPELAAELVRLPVDVIVASATSGVRAAQQATRTAQLAVKWRCPLRLSLIASRGPKLVPLSAKISAGVAAG